MRCRLLLGLLVVVALSVGRAGANDFDGIWVGGYAPAGAEITMQGAIVGQLARFEIEMKRWVGYGERATCQYYARLDDNAWGELILNLGSSSGECARRGRIGVTRHRPDQVAVSLSGLREIPDFTLNEVIRPLGEGERAVLPDSFDILGVSLGMTREEIEKNLIEGRGFVQGSESGNRANKRSNWIAETIIYRRDTTNGSTDKIIVTYSARRHDGSAGRDVAVMVRRNSHLGWKPNLLVDVLREALTRKYGAPTQDDDRRFGRDGQLVGDHADLSQFCEPGTRQKVDGHPFHLSDYFRSHCGSELDIRIKSQVSTGLVEEYWLTLTSVDYLNNGHWLKLAIDMWAEIEAFLEAMEGAATSDPEL